MRKSLILTAIAALFVAVTVLSRSALAAGELELPPVEFKSLPVGTVLEYDKFTCTVSRSRNFETICDVDSGGKIHHVGNVQLIGDVRKTPHFKLISTFDCFSFPVALNELLREVTLGRNAKDALKALWPLKVGKETSYQVVSRSSRQRRTYEDHVRVRVVETEGINVNCNNYQVYVIEQVVKREHRCTANYSRTLWFEPKLGVIVKERIERTDRGFFKGKTSEIELVNVTFSGDAPAMASAKPSRKPSVPRTQQSAVRVQLDETPPVIDVPKAVETGNPVVKITGHISDDSRIMEVMLGDKSIPLAADGTIEVKRTVPLGISTFTITAFDEWGNQSRQTVKVRRSDRVVASVSTQAEQRQSAFPDVNSGTYHAIVIGNNDYAQMPNLKTAVNDAEAVAWTLDADYGFEVTTLINATRAEIIGALAKARATLKFNDNLLVYYAGHGVLDSYAEEGYWLPVDAEENNPANWVSNGDITNMLRAIRAKHVMVVADSCYSGTLVRSTPGKILTAKERATWIKRMVKKRTRTALVSGGLEPVMDAGGGDNSIFAKAFLDALHANKDVLEGQKLFAMIKRPVALESDQTPQYSDVRRAGHDGGDFMFVRQTPQVSAVAEPITTPESKPDASQAPDRGSFELTFWKSVKESDNPADFEAYLDQYPSGVFTALAGNRLKELEQSKVAALPSLKSNAPEPSLTPDERNGKWVGSDNRWEITLLVDGSSVRGNVRNTGVTGDVKGTIDSEGRVEAWTALGNFAQGILKGRLPDLKLSGGGLTGGANFKLKKVDE